MTDLVARLREAGCVFAEEEAALLSEAASGYQLDELAARRIAGEPLEHLLGWVEFAGLRVRVGPGVFVPRRRTELLVREALASLQSPEHHVFVELCCGCAPVATAVAAHRPDVEVFASDLDPTAVACAARNLGSQRVAVGDLFDGLPTRLGGRVTVLAVNAPYVPSGEIAFMPSEARDHEPQLALDGGPEGVSVHRRVAAEAADWLAPGGVVLVETSRRQAGLTSAAFASNGFAALVVRDDGRDATVIRAGRPGE